MKVGGPEFRQLVVVARTLFIALLLITSGFYGYDLLLTVANSYGQTPLRFDSLPWPTRDSSGRLVDSFRPGEAVFVDAAFTVSIDGLLHSDIILVGEDGAVARKLQSTDTPIQAGRYQTTARATSLPADVAPGRYRLQGTSSLDGKIRDVIATWETTTFEIAP